MFDRRLLYMYLACIFGAAMAGPVALIALKGLIWLSIAFYLPVFLIFSSILLLGVEAYALCALYGACAGLILAGLIHVVSLFNFNFGYEVAE